MTHICTLTVKILPSFCVWVIVVVASDKNGEVFGKILVSSVADFVLVVVVGVIVVNEKIEGRDLQLTTLQGLVLDKSLDLMLSQYEMQDRTLVLSPSPHVLLQDDHSLHEAYSDGPEKTLKNGQKIFCQYFMKYAVDDTEKGFEKYKI